MRLNKLLTVFASAIMLLGGVLNANADVTYTMLSATKTNNGEGAEKLLDGQGSTKWGESLNNGDTRWIVFKASTGICPSDYVLTVANDTPGNPGRQWQKWRIYGANFINDFSATRNADGWVLLDSKSEINDEEFPTGSSNNSYQQTTFTLSEGCSTYYEYFKIEVDEIRQSGQYMQMGDFAFATYTEQTTAELYGVKLNMTKSLNMTGLDESDVWSVEVPTLIARLDDAYANAQNSGDYTALQSSMDLYLRMSTAIAALAGNAKIAAFDGSACWGDGHYTQLFDGQDGISPNKGTKWGGNFSGEEGDAGHVQYVIFRVKEAFAPYFYKLVTGGDTQQYNGRNWKTWSVYGANFASVTDATKDANGWVELDKREKISEKYLPMESNYPATFDFNQGVSVPYLYYMVKVFAAHNGNATQMNEMYLCTQEEFEAVRQPLVEELVEFAAGLDALVVEDDKVADKATFVTLYDELKTTADAVRLTEVYNELVALRNKLNESAAFVTGFYRCLGGNTGWNDTENWTKLVDGKYTKEDGTKWGGGMPEGGSYVIFRAYGKNPFNQYMLVTGNDTKNSSGRNWKTWKIYGANIKGDMDEMATRDFGSWTLIDEKTNIGQDRLPADNYAPAYFNFTNPGSYKYFKIEVEAAYNGNDIQMSEFKMLSDAEYAAIRQEYVDSLNKLQSKVEIPVALSGTIDMDAKIAEVTTATADNLLPKFSDALDYITVEVPAMIAASQLVEVEGVYQIGTAIQLASFAVLVNGGENEAKAVLTADIDLSEAITDAAWTSIGNSSVPFKGEFDGQGYTIKNITYTATGQYNGLFGKLSTGAVVKNFTAEGTMTVSKNIESRAVALIGVAGDGGVLIQNINSKMNYNNQLAGSQIGGILGGALDGNATVVDRCTYSGTLDGNDAGGSGNYGGLVGYANNSGNCYLTISNCLFDGKLINTAATPGNCTFGGMVGYSNGARVTIKNVLSIGTVESKVAAQFFGAVKSTRSSINNSYYQGENVNGSSSTVTLEGAVKVTDEQLSSGEVAAKLGAAFRQTLGTDAYPTLDATKDVIAQITEAGYATLYVPETALTIPKGVEAYTAEFESTWLKLNAVTGTVAAGEPVVLKGAAGFYGFAPADAVAKVEGNVLKGADTDIEASGKYVLAKVEDKVGFYLADKGTIKAGKAFIVLEGETGPLNEVKAFYFDGDAETAITNVNVNDNDNQAVIYNVAGQRISKMQKGINIVNGKKVLK